MFFIKRLKLPIVLATAIAVLLPTHTVMGKDAKVSPHGEQAKGMVALNLGRYDEAAEHLEAAYGQTQDPLILFSLGQAYRLSGNYGKALASFNAFLRSVSLLPKYRPQVDRAATEIELITSTQFRQQVTPGKSKDLNLNDFGLYLEDPASKEIEPTPLEPAIADKNEAKDDLEPPKTDLTPTIEQLASSTPVSDAPAGLTLTDQSKDIPVQTEQKSILKNWWFWSGVATVAAMGGAATWYFTHPAAQAPNTSFGSIRVYR